MKHKKMTQRLLAIFLTLTLANIGVAEEKNEATESIKVSISFAPYLIAYMEDQVNSNLTLLLKSSKFQMSLLITMVVVNQTMS